MKNKQWLWGLLLLPFLQLSPNKALNFSNPIKPSDSLETKLSENTTSPDKPNNSSNIDVNDTIEITSAIYLSVNKYEDPATKIGIENALKSKYEYENPIGIDSALFKTYGASTADVLVIGGHHFTGATYVHDNTAKIAQFKTFEKYANPNIKFILFRSCHAVVNPDYLNEEVQKGFRISLKSAETYLQEISNMAPNARLIVGYETKSSFKQDNALIVLAQNLDILSKEGLKAYGEYAINLGLKMYEIPGHEKNKKGEWTYEDNYHDNKLTEGTRIAYYLLTSDTEKEKVWTYFSYDHPEGIDIILPKKEQTTVKQTIKSNKETSTNILSNNQNRFRYNNIPSVDKYDVLNEQRLKSIKQQNNRH